MKEQQLPDSAWAMPIPLSPAEAAAATQVLRTVWGVSGPPTTPDAAYRAGLADSLQLDDDERVLAHLLGDALGAIAAEAAAAFVILPLDELRRAVNGGVSRDVMKVAALLAGFYPGVDANGDWTNSARGVIPVIRLDFSNLIWDGEDFRVINRQRATAA